MQHLSSFTFHVFLLFLQHSQTFGHGHETMGGTNNDANVNADKSVETDEEMKAAQAAMEDPELFGGDMVGVSRDQLMRRNHVFGLTWDNAVVPYIVHESLKRVAWKLESSISEYHSKTCIRFKPRTNETDYLVFRDGKGCSSTVGKQGGAQYVTLNKHGCLHHRVIIHEMGHALGLLHTQMRQDRDDNVVVICQSIKEGHIHNFGKFFGKIMAPYDTKSIMHYNSYTFSANGNPTILTTDGDLIKVAYELSESDVKILNTLYKCEDKKK